MNTNFKKSILIDLDGVLNTYTGDFDENYIPLIKEGAFEFLKKLSEKYDIKIFTSRKLSLVSEWVKENNLENFICDVINVKEPSYLIVDDRCISFDGNYHTTINNIEHYVEWYKINNN